VQDALRARLEDFSIHQFLDLPNTCGDNTNFGGSGKSCVAKSGYNVYPGPEGLSIPALNHLHLPCNKSRY